MEELAPRTDAWSPARTGIPQLDRLLPGGGLPRGRPVEWWGPPSCGKTALLRRALGGFLDEGEPVAVVDGARTLYAPDWTGLWERGGLWVIRPPEEEALRCTDLLLRSGAFGAVALDTGEGFSLSFSRSSAVRLQRLAEEAGAVWIVLGELPLATLRLRFRPARLEPTGDLRFGPFLPPVRPVWVWVGGGPSREVPVLCPALPERIPRFPVRDRKGPRTGPVRPPSLSRASE